MDDNQQRLLTTWYSAQAELAAIKEKEATLRLQVVEAFFPGAVEGTHSLPLNDGWKLTTTVKFNYNLVKAEKGQPDPVAAMLAEMNKTEAGQILSPRLIRWSPDISVTEYRKLPAQFKPMVDKILIIKPGAPTVAVVPPTKAK